MAYVCPYHLSILVSIPMVSVQLPVENKEILMDTWKINADAIGELFHLDLKNS